MAKSYKLEDGNYIDDNSIIHDTDEEKITIYEEIEKLKGTILYEDETGTTGTVNLIDNAENYKYIEIYYKTSVRSGSIKVSDFNDKKLILPIIVVTSVNHVLQTKIITISRKKINKIEEEQYLSNTGYSTTNSIYIYKVVGYK